MDPHAANIPPEWLAAYADGEMDRNAILAQVKKQVEDWLAEHPEARADIEEQRRLRDLWEETTPVEPDPASWAKELGRLEQSARDHKGRRAGSWGWLAGLLTMTAAAVWLAYFLSHKQVLLPTVEGNNPFAVATAEEIDILSVEGDDTNTFAVGDMPVRGPLELVGPGEVRVTQVESAVQDNMRLDVQEGPATPMIWARLDSD